MTIDHVWNKAQCIFNYPHFDPSIFCASIISALLYIDIYISVWKQRFQSSRENRVLCSFHYMLKSYFRTTRVPLGTVYSSSSYPPMTYVHVGNSTRVTLSHFISFPFSLHNCWRHQRTCYFVQCFRPNFEYFYVFLNLTFCLYFSIRASRIKVKIFN